MHNLYVITRGLVLYGGRVLTRGAAWGDDVILSDPRYVRCRTKHAIETPYHLQVPADR